MTVRLYRSFDGGASSLTGAAGSMITLLDSVLVNGYNSKTVTITRSGSVATATCASHGFPPDGVTRITISGAAQAEYNIETYITNVTTDTFDYTVTGSPATPATGTINAIVTPAGWTKGYTGTNLATYKNATSTVGSIHQRQLRVDDTTTTNSLVVGYESMSSVSYGIGPMPTPVQATSGLTWGKSSTANATARPWYVIASENFFYIFTDPAGTTITGWPSAWTSSFNGHCYGDFTPFYDTDLYPTVLLGGTGITASTLGYMYAIGTPAIAGVFTGHYVQRSVNNMLGAKQIIKAGLYASSAAVGPIGTGYVPAVLPNVQTIFNPVFVQEVAVDGALLRGKFPGLYDPGSVYSLWQLGDIVVPQSGTASGKKFIVLKPNYVPTNTQICAIMIDITDWA